MWENGVSRHVICSVKETNEPFLKSDKCKQLLALPKLKECFRTGKRNPGLRSEISHSFSPILMKLFVGWGDGWVTKYLLYKQEASVPSTHKCRVGLSACL